MLPGLRFLFAAIALSISLLIFGLGAAALLRAAHQEFASLPTRPAPPEPVFASQSDGTMPSLAMLRVDEQTADQAKPERGTTDDNPADARPESSPSIAAATATPPPAAEPDSVALPVTVLPEAQNPAEVPASETAVRVESPAEAQVPSATKSTASDAPVVQVPLVQVPVAEVPPAAEAPGISEAPSSAETKLATTETVTPPANQPADPEPTSAAMPATDAVETKIAALNPAPNDIETQASPIKPRHRSANRAEKKRQQAERVIKRRRMARRASALRRASQAPADPFGAQPFGGFTGTSRTQ